MNSNNSTKGFNNEWACEALCIVKVIFWIQRTDRPYQFLLTPHIIIQLVEFLEQSSKGPPFDFIEVRARNIQSKALYPNFWRYIRTILRFCKEETEVRKQQLSMKTTYAYFKSALFWALDMAPTLDVAVLFNLLFLADHVKIIRESEMKNSCSSWNSAAASYRFW